MAPGPLIVTIVVGTLMLVGGILIAVMSAVQKATEREAAELAGEGILLDSGTVNLTAKFRNFRGPRVYIGVGGRRGPARVVLTKQRFTFLPSGKNRFGFARMDHAGLARFKVGVSEGQLHMHTDDPPHASGTVDLHLEVPDPGSWVRALIEAGAQAM
jgi:hypothetical protein